jgi:hypothetical protein
VLALQGRFDAARTEFEAALAIAPEVDYLQANLRHLDRLSGVEAPGTPTLVLKVPPLAAPPTVAPVPDAAHRAPEAAAVVVIAALTGVAAPAVVQAPVTVTAAEPGVVVIPAAAMAAAEPTAAAPPPVAAAPTPFRLEVANGNGVTGMARYVGRLLAAEGLPRARLSNQKPYVEPRTRVEYRAGFEPQARALSERLPGRPGVAVASALRPVTDVRVVLGRDLPRTLNFALDARPLELAAAEGLTAY